MRTALRRVPWPAVLWLVLLLVPWLGTRFYTFLATEIVILALFAVSLNLLLGYTGLVSFGHAAYFGIGAYTCAILMKTHGVPFPAALIVAGAAAAGFAVVFGFFCVRSTRIYFAMLTLAFAQIVWAVCFKWNAVTGGEQGLSNVPYPDFAILVLVAAARKPAHGRSLLPARDDRDRRVLLSACAALSDRHLAGC